MPAKRDRKPVQRFGGVSRQIARKGWNGPQEGLKWLLTIQRAEGNKAMVSEKQRAWYKANKERLKVVRAAWYKANKERHATLSKNWKQSHAEQYAEKSKEWREANKDKRKDQAKERDKQNRNQCAWKTHKRRAVLLAAGNYTVKEWIEVKLNQRYRCLACGFRKPLAVDHVVPVSKGGANTIDNIQGLCRECNSSKGAKVIDYRLLNANTIS